MERVPVDRLLKEKIEALTIKLRDQQFATNAPVIAPEENKEADLALDIVREHLGMPKVDPMTYPEGYTG